MLSTQVLAASRDCQSARRARVRQARRGPNAAVPCVRPEGRAPLSILVALRQTTPLWVAHSRLQRCLWPNAQSVSLFGAFLLAHWWAIITRVSYELTMRAAAGVCDNGASPDTRGAAVGSATYCSATGRCFGSIAIGTIGRRCSATRESSSCTTTLRMTQLRCPPERTRTQRLRGDHLIGRCVSLARCDARCECTASGSSAVSSPPAGRRS